MRQLSTYLLLACLFCSCHEDIDNTAITEDRPIPETTIEGELAGRAYDNNGEPFSDYTLIINGERLSFDAGYHYQSFTDLRKFGQIIYLEQDQEVIGFSNNLLIENDINALDIMAFPSPLSNTISGDSEFININNDLSIGINRSQLLDNQGVNPSSDILVNHLETSAPKLLSQCGTFAYTQDMKLLVVDAINVFMIDLFSGNNPLTIDPNNPLQLQSTVTDATLFYLDDERGTWIELSSGTTMPITNTGYYMLGYPAPGVYNEGFLMKEDKAVSYVDIQSEHELDDVKRYTKSTAQGKWALVSHKNENIDLNFTTPCGDMLLSTNIFSTDADKLDIVTDLNAALGLLPVEFELFNCAGVISDRPAIRIEADSDLRILPFLKTEVDVWIPVCDGELNVSGFDIVANIEGPKIDWRIDIPDALGYLSSCDQSENGFSLLKIRADLRMYNNANFAIEGLKTLVSGNNDRLRINYDGVGVGNYDGAQVRIFLEDFGFGNSGYRVTCENSLEGCGITELSVTHFDVNEGEWTRISFSGNLWMQTINPPQAGFFDVEGVLMHK